MQIQNKNKLIKYKDKDDFQTNIGADTKNDFEWCDKLIFTGVGIEHLGDLVMQHGRYSESTSTIYVCIRLLWRIVN
jgi:hypothetical protein